MVIQRIQSVYLLLGAIAAGLVCFLPFGASVDASGVAHELLPIDYPGVLVLNILITVLMLIDIFLYKNTRLQKRVAAISAFLTVVSAATCYLTVWQAGEEWDIMWCGTPICLACTFICALLARRGIIHDEKLLKSYDRIR